MGPTHEGTKRLGSWAAERKPEASGPPRPQYLPAMTDSVLAGYDRTAFTHDGKQRDDLPPWLGAGGHRHRRDPRHHAEGRRVRRPGGGHRVHGGPPAPLRHPGRDPLAGGRVRGVAYGLSSHRAGVRQPRVHRARHGAHVAGGVLAPGAGRRRARPLRRPRRGRRRHVLHRRLRAGDGHRRPAAGAGAVAAVAAVRRRAEAQADDRHLRRRPRGRQGSLRRRRAAGARAALPQRPVGPGGALRVPRPSTSATPSSPSSSTTTRPTRRPR